MNDNQEINREPCRLHKAQGLEAWCSRDNCIFWRLIEVQDLDMSNELGCGLQFYELLDSLTPEMAEWLLKMKQRLENTTPEAGKSRITFKRREQE
ncbi:MAG: hypothetical protein ACYC6O_03195 [Thermoleophilia bacterium]